MNQHTVQRLLLCLLLGAATTLGCSDGDRGCTELCEEAQAGDCTAIQGDCGGFCDAIDGSKDRANCDAQYSAYVDCLNASANVCDGSGCLAEEDALTDCYTPFCTANPTDPDCVTLIGSL